MASTGEPFCYVVAPIALVIE